MINEMQTYRTADFTIICTLRLLGFPIIQHERDLRSYERAIAVFKRTEELEQTLQALHNRKLRVEPSAFLEMTRAVKAQLRDCE